MDGFDEITNHHCLITVALKSHIRICSQIDDETVLEYCDSTSFRSVFNLANFAKRQHSQK